MTTLKSFEELDCYQVGREFRNLVAKITKRFPANEEHRLKPQLLRAARSVTANIAEGFGRHHHQENLQYCRQARGSLSECLDHLNVALDEGFIDQDCYTDLRNEHQRAARLLNGYIAYLRKKAAGPK
jgi:four helix bundle protein